MSTIPNIQLPPPPGPNRRSFAERHGRGPNAERLEVPELVRLVFSVLDQLMAVGLFAEALGKDCVDADFEPGTLGHDPQAYFLRIIGRKNVWPYYDHADEYDLDTLCDVVEALYDVISWPTLGNFHDYARCGWHYERFDRERGKKALRDHVNVVLGRYYPPLRLESSGEIVEIGDRGLEPLLSARLPVGADDSVAERVESAIRVFRDRHANTDAMRHAVRDLTDALESLRGAVKESMLSKDESELFRLANGFTIRHMNRDQRGDYDSPTWLRWAFYVYLATVHAVLRVKARQADRGG